MSDATRDGKWRNLVEVGRAMRRLQKECREFKLHNSPDECPDLRRAMRAAEKRFDAALAEIETPGMFAAAEPPADDGVEVTVAWAADVTPPEMMNPVARLKAMYDESSRIRDLDGEDGPPVFKTRGEWRRLCRLLGYPTKDDSPSGDRP